MLENTDKVRVENRSSAIVGYKLSEMNIKRRFQAYEVKEIPMSELRAVIQVPGIYRTILNNLIIHDKSAVEELLPYAEPEYMYTVKDVDFLLERGSLDQLKDALDFAPEGVVALIKERAVKNEVNDVQKRSVIFEWTGFNVNKAIEIKYQSQETATDDDNTKVRRASAPVVDNAETPAAPARRASAPKYQVVK